MEKGNANIVYVDYENISKVLKVGSRVYVDDGLISLVVTAISTYHLFIFFWIEKLNSLKIFDVRMYLKNMQVLKTCWF